MSSAQANALWQFEKRLTARQQLICRSERHVAERHDEFAPFHCPVPPVLSTKG